jgi:hypothetical protein
MTEAAVAYLAGWVTESLTRAPGVKVYDAWHREGIWYIPIELNDGTRINVSVSESAYLEGD